jgi:hypothetical protein
LLGIEAGLDESPDQAEKSIHWGIFTQILVTRIRRLDTVIKLMMAVLLSILL